MTEIFKINGKDKREELLQAIKDDAPFVSQAMGGRDIEAFDDEHGFVLLEKEKNYAPKSDVLKRVDAVINVSNLLGRVSLRTIYYTLRGMPEYTALFESGNFNAKFLNTISKEFEIICDVDRDIIAFGTPDGLVFHPYNRRYNDKNRIIALSEDIATTHLTDDDVKHVQNILIDEKLSNLQEIISDDSDFLKMTNMVAVSRGGRPNRAILKLVNRFETSKQVLLWMDSDLYGCDMRETVRRGSKNLRHQTLHQTSPRAYDIGLFPSVGKELGLSPDIDSKLPLNSTSGQQMLKHLENSNFNETDLNVFRENLTYEIEAVHAKFLNKKGHPIGTQLYLTECLRILNLKCKPSAPIDDKELKEELSNELIKQLEQQLRESLDEQINLDVNINTLDNLIIDFREQKINEIMLQNKDKIAQILAKVSMTDLRDRINNWYVYHMKSEIYNLSDIVNEMVKEIKIEVNFNFKNLQNEIDVLIEKISENIQDELSNTEITTSIQLKEFEKVKIVMNYYDAILKRIGASSKDALKIRNALKERLDIE